MIHTIVPAAGRSSRIGRVKALLPLGDRPAIERLEEVLRAANSEIVCVIAAGEYRLRQWCDQRSMGYITNPSPELGMLESIHLGLQSLALEEGEDHTVIVCPVDHAGIQLETLKTLIHTAQTASDGLTLPTLRGRRGHPLVLRGEPLSQVELVSKSVGLRQLLEWHHPLEVAVEDEAVIRDLDGWNDWIRSQPDP